ncbi:hypothetical protein TWF102_002245 [Orbilia oligospora]|uniref:Uncharacterized protein n=1 Tax=Orbilia oligospora TaxID=2813651 RepID=A0A7C8NJ98_ORBOL|nr:hypothetical protein TWF706_007749 [Orbilia oligospora]KAF3105315.1 hypothetical protein TWF102_002245 [Orbilia oligospora]KAF3112476.1 hypothetical protein TWF103_003239 [Orbilia oligospora]
MYEMFFGKAPPRTSIYTRAHVCAKILMLAFNIEKIYATPLISDTYQNVTMANVTGHPFNNHSGISVFPTILNTTVPIDTHSINTTAPAYTHSINNTSSNLTLSIGGKKSCANCEINSIDSNGSESPIQTDPQADTLNLNSTKKDVHPSFFYKNNKLRIMCAPSLKVLDIEPHENPVNFPYEHWPHWKKEYVDKSRARVDIEVRQSVCRGSCTCDENGAIIPRDHGRIHPCGRQWQADRCSVVLGCWCTAVLVQAVVGENRASIEEYQAALNRIPQTVRNDNQGYFWRMNGLGLRPWDTMTWEPSEMDRMLTIPPPPQALERIPEILLGPHGRPRTFDPTPRRGRPYDDTSNGSN